MSEGGVETDPVVPEGTTGMLSESQRAVYDKVMEYFDHADNGLSNTTVPPNMVITGEAGSGKTFLVNALVGEFGARGIPVFRGAFTGTAASLMGGKTLFSLLPPGFGTWNTRPDMEQRINHYKQRIMGHCAPRRGGELESRLVAEKTPEAGGSSGDALSPLAQWVDFMKELRVRSEGFAFRRLRLLKYSCMRGERKNS